MRISDWSSDVRSSDLQLRSQKKQENTSIRDVIPRARRIIPMPKVPIFKRLKFHMTSVPEDRACERSNTPVQEAEATSSHWRSPNMASRPFVRSEEHTSELQSLMRISYAVFCLKKKTKKQTTK